MLDKLWNSELDGSTNDSQLTPVLPLFVQMNVMFTGKDDHWREISRWVKYREDVEEEGTRWSKPYVPSIPLTSIMNLKYHISNGEVILDGYGDDIDKIVESISKQSIDMKEEHLKHLLSHGVKLHMKLNKLRLVSTSVISRHNSYNRQPSLVQEPVLEDGISGDCSEFTPKKSSIIDREKSKKMREHNLFVKKVPKGSEACNIFSTTVDFVTSIKILFVRLNKAIILEDFCEIPIATRFIGIVLGPPGSENMVTELGRTFGTIMSDQIFPLLIYRASSKEEVLKAIDNYTEDLTVLPPSAWDPEIRLEPPKSAQSLDKRLTNKRNYYESLHLHKGLFNKDLKGEEDEKGEDHLSNTEKNQLIPQNSTTIYKQNSLVSTENGHFVLNGENLDTKGNDFFIDDSGHGNDKTLKRTGKLFGGLIEDIKRKAPWYLSDFTDAFHIQTLASIIYIYLATITKAITFGGFLSDITNGLQGVLESFLGHALAGGIFCLFAGQPLTVLGCTGPVLIFEKILMDSCKLYDSNYITVRLWIGLWCSFFCIVIVALDMSSFVRYFTRFTEESFATLIGVIFIVEALKKLLATFISNPVYIGHDPNQATIANMSCNCLPPDNQTGIRDDIEWNNLTLQDCKSFGGNLIGESCGYVPDIFFFSLILFLGTFILASELKKFKFTNYFNASIRSLISDYAVIIAICIFVGIDSYFQLDTPKLIVPTEFKPTRSELRGWIIPFIDNDTRWYIYILTSFPALLLTILLFMDQQITTVIVNRKEHKLVKGCGYHLDMLVVGIMTGVCSILGLPWCVAATVLCLGHVDSLKMETETSAPGEVPQFLGVREQRVTGTMVFLLTGLSVKLAPILKYIPMSVLYGVLMYMGFASLKGMQFIDRIGLFFMSTKSQPDHKYLRHVSLNKVYWFTMIQVIALALLWIIKSTPASLIFPLMVLALVGFRRAMDYFPRLFTQQDLYWLDNLMPDSKKKQKSEVDVKNDEEDVKTKRDQTLV
ncbi:electrogenic sodium bicarbonate cotransporter 1 isoform X2 [Lepeophtheirus salmonis]|nr:electrogenic sodium bicarbonate cotransporter 1-like isoform X2 [Lepeophtheirus salmonis]